MDVSNPEAPTLLGSYDTPDFALHVYVSGNRAYVADGYSGLHIIDVSNPEAPALLGSYDTPGFAEGIYVSGSRAYVADGSSGLHIIDVSNPEAPALLGSYDTPGFAGSIYVSGSRVYVADGSSGLHIIDVSCGCQCPADSSEGCISGQVANKETGEPFAGKVVRLKRRGPKNPRIRKTVVTDIDGGYNFTGLEDGTYKIKVKSYRRCKGGRKKSVVIRDGVKVHNDVDFECKKKKRRR
ncbi:MAG: carboxypeptidase regulatory-like domain-containing protein [Candidatus Brocadiales bacterium]